MKEHRVFPLWLPVLGICVGLALFFWSRQDHVATATITATTIAAFAGYRAGALKLIGLLVGGAVAFLFAPGWGRALADQLDVEGPTRGGFVVIAVGLGVIVAAALIAKRLTRAVVHQRPVMESLNHWTGFAMGGIQGSAVLLLLIGGILVTEPLARKSLTARGGSPADRVRAGVARSVVVVARETRKSMFGPWIARNNPFERSKSLRRVRRTVEEMRQRIPATPSELMQDLSDPRSSLFDS